MRAILLFCSGILLTSLCGCIMLADEPQTWPCSNDTDCDNGEKCQKQNSYNESDKICKVKVPCTTDSCPSYQYCSPGPGARYCEDD